MEESRTGPSLAWRLAAAVALTIGFYTLALLIAAALLAAAILPWVLGGSSNLWVTVTCFILGVTILVAIFPRRRKYEPHGVRLMHGNQPRLLAMIGEEAKAAGARARAMRAQYGDVLGDAKVADLSDLAQDVGPIAGALQRREPELPDEAAPNFAATLLAEALLAALADDGWTVEAGLAEPVRACRGDDRIAPYDAIAELHGSGPAAAEWRERTSALGIADLQLTAGATAAA